MQSGSKKAILGPSASTTLTLTLDVTIPIGKPASCSALRVQCTPGKGAGAYVCMKIFWYCRFAFSANSSGNPTAVKKYFIGLIRVPLRTILLNSAAVVILKPRPYSWLLSSQILRCGVRESRRTPSTSNSTARISFICNLQYPGGFYSGKWLRALNPWKRREDQEHDDNVELKSRQPLAVFVF